MPEKDPIPPSLEYLRHYFEAERAEWQNTPVGTEVVVEAGDIESGQTAYFPFRLIAAEPTKNGLGDAWVELGEQNYNFVNANTREVVKLPAGTIMKGGISCQHFPETSLLMSYWGGISVDRDYSFEDVLTPNGEFMDGVLVANVSKLFSFAPENEYKAPESFNEYKKVVNEQRAKDKAEQDQWEVKLDSLIAETVERLFTDEERRELSDIIVTFHSEGRYRLYCLLEHSETQGLVPNYLPALKKVMDEEFGWDVPGWRGYTAFPSSRRGWPKLIREIGLRKPD